MHGEEHHLKAILNVQDGYLQYTHAYELFLMVKSLLLSVVPEALIVFFCLTPSFLLEWNLHSSHVISERGGWWTCLPHTAGCGTLVLEESDRRP